MATSYLSRSDDEFWKMTPRVLVTLIDQWKKIEKGKAAQAAYIAAGGDPEDVGMSEAEIVRQEYEMGANMW
jgi:hypothetical protein